MKKTLFLTVLFLALAFGSSYAQKYALIDMEYILENIPEYKNGNTQLETASDKWQKEVDALSGQVEAMYKKYQLDLPRLTSADKTKRENEIVAKEKEIQDVRNKYFGTEGELFKQREAFMKPIQDNIYEAVKSISASEGYAMVIDRASAVSVIFATPEIDISDRVLAVLGY